MSDLTGVSVSLSSERFSGEKKSPESNIGGSDNNGDIGKTVGRAIIDWGGQIASYACMIYGSFWKCSGTEDFLGWKKKKIVIVTILTLFSITMALIPIYNTPILRNIAAEALLGKLDLKDVWCWRVFMYKEVTIRHLEALELKGGDGGVCAVIWWLLALELMLLKTSKIYSKGLLLLVEDLLLLVQVDAVEWRTHTLIWRNKIDLEDQSLDDLFNLKIFETEVKSLSSASPTTQNIAFVSSQNTNSTNESVSAVTSVFAASPKVPVSAFPNVDTLSDATGRNLGDNGTTSSGFDMSKVECYNCHKRGQFAKERRSPKDTRQNVPVKSQRKNVPVETSTSNALVSQCDSVGHQLLSLRIRSLTQKMTLRSRPAKTVVTKPHSSPRRSINHSSSPKASNFPPKVTTVKAPKVNDVMGVQGNWDKGVIDSGCSRHMTGNMSFLTDFEEINGGYVVFGRNPKGGKIIGKDNECIVLSPDFKLPDENHVLLRVPRENNMYNVDLKNIVPSRNLTRLFAKATLDEYNLWHRKLGHINFKTMNKLVKGNLVRGLPSKVFENKHTCVSCKKGKQHRASYKIKPVSFEEGIDYEEVFAPVARIKAIRLFPAYASFMGFMMYQMDEKRAFLYGTIEEEVYVCQPPGFEDPDYPAKVYKVVKALYGLHQAPRAWKFSFTDVKSASTPIETEKSLLKDSDGSGPTWMFDIDTLTKSMNYQPVTVGNHPNLSAEEPMRVHQALKDPSWIKAMQEELLQFKMQKEEGIDYEEVVAPVARIEAIRLFLAYASFIGFMVYQMDVKSAFMYGTIKEEVYVYQPSGFEDPDYSDKVYKVVKALYGLHQAPRAWYKNLANYLLENGFQRGKIDQTLFIKRQKENGFQRGKIDQTLFIKKKKGDILLVQVYVDDIIFGSTNKDLCKAFEKFMKDKFQMSSMGKLTLFLDQMVSGKDSSNLLRADNLPNYIWYSTHHVALMKSWLVQKQTALGQTSTGKENSNPFMAGSLPKTILLTFILEISIDMVLLNSHLSI
nr:hypothetical protein [Tanacetum cinerariifolium]